MTERSVFFAGGGTGGHIYPALAVAEKIKQLAPQTNIHFFVSQRDIDTNILSKTDFQFTTLPAIGFSLTPLGVLNFLKKFCESRKIAKKKIKQAPNPIVVAVGGFVAGPVGHAAKKLKTPLKLINVDIIPGKANKLLAKWADQAFLQYQDTQTFFQKKGIKTEITGCPLRTAFETDTDKNIKQTLNLDENKKTLLITGASSGAVNINDAVCANLPNLEKYADTWQIIHLTGHANFNTVKPLYDQAKIKHKILDYFDNMGQLLRSADLIVGRSGAVSVAEFQAAQTPVICMPYPYHKDRHQYLNAQKLVNAASAIIVDDIPNKVDRAGWLWDELNQLMNSETKKLQKMKENAQKLPKNNAAQKITEIILNLG